MFTRKRFETFDANERRSLFWSDDRSFFSNDDLSAGNRLVNLEAASFSGKLHDAEVDPVELLIFVGDAVQGVTVAEEVAAFQSGRRRQYFCSRRHYLL